MPFFIRFQQAQFRLLVHLGTLRDATADDLRECLLLSSGSVLPHLSLADPGLTRAAGIALALRAGAMRRLANNNNSKGASSLALAAAMSHPPAIRYGIHRKRKNFF